MIRQRHRVTAGIFLVADLAATAASFLAAWVVRFRLDLIPGTKSHIPDFARYLHLLPFVLVLWAVVFYFHGLYQSRRGRSRIDESVTILVAIFLAAVLLSVGLAWFRSPEPTGPRGVIEYFTYSRAFLALFAIFDLAAVIMGRAVVRSALRLVRLSGYNLQRILVVGAGVLGQEVVDKLQAHQELGIEVLGYLDDDPGKQGSTLRGAPVLGSLRDIDSLLAARSIDQVFIALPPDAHRKTLRILQAVGRECVEVKLVPDILQYATLQASLEDLDGTPVINLSQVPLQGWNSLVKRLMDLAIASLALFCLVPFLPFVALAIWIEDRGPIFYRQERMGLDGKSFMILKFRSMQVNAEASSGPVWAVRNDPRRTRVGTFLRRWSIDELPQLWNVLTGEMSIIGPRPERPAFVNEFKHKVPQYMLRHRVRAGITGWAQVHGWRGNTSIKKRIQYDLYYIENWSLKLDLKILWMTVRSGLRHNAY